MVKYYVSSYKWQIWHFLIVKGLCATNDVETSSDEQTGGGLGAGGIALVGLAGVTSLVSIPFVIGASVAWLPAAIPMYPAYRYLQGKDKRKYIKNKSTIMEEWAAQYFEANVTEEYINSYMLESYNKYFKQQIGELFEKRINVIKDSNKLQKAQREYIHAKRILQSIQPMQMRMENMIGQLRLYTLRYAVSVESIFMDREVGIGEFSTVYRVVMHETNAPQRDVFLKVMRHSTRGREVLDSLNELDCLR